MGTDPEANQLGTEAHIENINASGTVQTNLTPQEEVNNDSNLTNKGMKKIKSTAVLSDEMNMIISIDRKAYKYEAFADENNDADPNEGDSVGRRNSGDIYDERSPLSDGLRQRSNKSTVENRVLTEEDLDEHFTETNSYSIPGYIGNYCSKAWKNLNVKRSLLSTLPIIGSIKQGYSFNALQRDIILGLTLAIITIPQGLAYSLVTNIPAQYGLFNAFLPPIIYMFVGSSVENSVGPFALTSLVIAQQVGSIAPELNDMPMGEERMYATVAIVLALSFWTGILLIIMSFLRFGWVISLMSEPALNSYVTSLTVTILLTQLGSALALKTPTDSKFVGTVEAIFGNLDKTNVCSLLIGFATFMVIWACDMFAKWRKIKSPIPSQIFMVIVTTLVAWGFDFETKYNLKVTGTIKTGLPQWDFPVLTDFSKFIAPSIILALVVFILTCSVSKQMAIANGRTVDYNQELLALGLCSFIGAMFQSHAASGSLARSAVANNLKPGSIFWNVVKAFVVLLVLLWLAPLLKYLPSATLAAIIIAALRNTVFALLEPITLWKRSSSDFIVYIIVFFVTLFTDTTIGMIAAAGCSILVLFAQMARPQFSLMGRVPGSSFYKDIKSYRQVELDDQVLVVSFHSQLHFANQDYFCDKVTEQINDAIIQNEKNQGALLDMDQIVLDLEPHQVNNDESNDMKHKAENGHLEDIELGDMPTSKFKGNPSNPTYVYDDVSNKNNSNSNANKDDGDDDEKKYATKAKQVHHSFPDSLFSSKLFSTLPPNLKVAVVINCASINEMDLTSTNMMTRLTSRMKNDTLFVFAACNKATKRMLRLALAPHVKYPGMLMFHTIDEAVRFSRACISLVRLTKLKGEEVQPIELTIEQLEIISEPIEGVTMHKSVCDQAAVEKRKNHQHGQDYDSDSCSSDNEPSDNDDDKHEQSSTKTTKLQANKKNSLYQKNNNSGNLSVPPSDPLSLPTTSLGLGLDVSPTQYTQNSPNEVSSATHLVNPSGEPSSATNPNLK